MKVHAPREAGVTLVELLAALLISSILITAAARIFLSGNLQFIQRSAESQRLGQLFRLKGAVQGLLKGDISRCAGGKLWLRPGEAGLAKQGEAESELMGLLKARFPELQASDFRCLEAAADGGALAEWGQALRPRLVEYRLVLGKKGVPDTLAGSWLK